MTKFLDCLISKTVLVELIFEVVSSEVEGVLGGDYAFEAAWNFVVDGVRGEAKGDIVLFLLEIFLSFWEVLGGYLGRLRA